MNGFDGIGARLWRSLLSIVVAYAVAIQSLLIAVAGFSLPAMPASNPDQSGCTHCIFCFAGAHHAVVGAAPTVFHHINVVMVVVRWRPDTSRLTRLSRYTIASPRGPPFSV
jgi:hypothetical protein